MNEMPYHIRVEDDWWLQMKRIILNLTEMIFKYIEFIWKARNEFICLRHNADVQYLQNQDCKINLDDSQ